MYCCEGFLSKTDTKPLVQEKYICTYFWVFEVNHLNLRIWALSLNLNKLEVKKFPKQDRRLPLDFLLLSSATLVPDYYSNHHRYDSHRKQHPNHNGEICNKENPDLIRVWEIHKYASLWSLFLHLSQTSSTLSSTEQIPWKICQSW